MLPCVFILLTIFGTRPKLFSFKLCKAFMSVLNVSFFFAYDVSGIMSEGGKISTEQYQLPTLVLCFCRRKPWICCLNKPLNGMLSVSLKSNALGREQVLSLEQLRFEMNYGQSLSEPIVQISTKICKEISYLTRTW